MSKYTIIHKYPDGGQPKPKPKRKPIIVTNPKDPRLKAYNDSLSVYNKNLLEAKQGDFNTGKVVSSGEKYLDKFKEKGIAPIGFYPYKNLDENNAYWTAFKEPVQPVVYQKSAPPERKDYPIKKLPKAQASITIVSPEQTTLPEANGQIVYGPSNGAIGFITEQGFVPIKRRDHLSKTNQADIDLLNNNEALQKYVKMNARFKYGGKNKSKYVCAVGGTVPPTFEEWLQQTGQQLLTGNEGMLYQQYQDYIATLQQQPTPDHLDATDDERIFSSTDEPQQPVARQGSRIQITSDPNQLDFSKGFKLFNAGLDLTSLIAAKVNNIKNRRKERYDYQKATYPKTQTNPYENGLNNVPIVYKTGGKNSNTTSELEKGEVFQQQDGSITKVPESHATHEDGGSKQPFVFRVLEDTSDKRKDFASKALKVEPVVALEIVGFKPSKSLSHSKLYEVATEYYEKELKKLQKDTENAVEYLKLSKDNYGRNTIDENMKTMQTMPTTGVLFDNIFAHQEQVKQRYGITNDSSTNKYGGNSYQVGGGEPLYKASNGKYYTKEALKYAMQITDAEVEKNIKSGLFQLVDSGTVPAEQVITSAKGMVAPPVTTTTTFAEPVYKSKDGTVSTAKQHQQAYGWTEQETQEQIRNGNLQPVSSNVLPNTGNLADIRARDKAYGRYKGKNPRVKGFPATLDVTIEPSTPQVDGPGLPDKYSSNSTIASPTKASDFNEPLHWYDVAGDIMGLIDNANRTAVPLEQLDRRQLRYREQSPLPTIQQGQEDFNTMVGMLPQNQLGFANQANLYGKKYSLNNQVFGQYENINKTGSANVDNLNAQQDFQVDAVNLQLRDQQQQRIMQGQATQQENKLTLFNNLFGKIAQNRALNRNGDLLMQMFPYFDQYGKFNNNRYNIAPLQGGNDKFKRVTTKGGAVRYVPA